MGNILNRTVIHDAYNRTIGRHQWCQCFCRWFISFHFKNWGEIEKDLIIFRAVSIILLFTYCIIDTIMYSSTRPDKSDALKFLHGSRYLALEILVIIYASGVAAFGVSVEIYPLFLYAIANCILVTRNCGGSSMMKIAIYWVFKFFFLFVAVELCHRNFRELRRYTDRFNSSARAMLRQALVFSITMLFLSSSGLTALYYAINTSLPHPCVYETNICGIINLYVPLFSYEDDICLGSLTSYVAGREQLRVLRNYMLLNGVAYSIFNVNFLEIRRDAKHRWLRIVLVLLYVALSTSVIISAVDSLFFIHRSQWVYTIIECIIFVILLSLLSYNLYKLRRSQRMVSPQATIPPQPMVSPQATIPPQPMVSPQATIPPQQPTNFITITIPEEAIELLNEILAELQANRLRNAENFSMERTPRVLPQS